MQTFFIGNSVTLSYVVTNPLQDPIYVNDADVEVTILDSEGAPIPDEVWPVALDYVGGSEGLYRKSFDPFASLVEGQCYQVVIDVVGQDGLVSQSVTYARAKTNVVH